MNDADATTPSAVGDADAEHGTAEGAGDGDGSRAPKKRHRLRTVLLLLAGCFVLLVGTLVGVGLYVQHTLTSQMSRIDGVFAGLDDRPARPTEGDAAEATNILLMGTDRRSEVKTTGSEAAAPDWLPGAQRTDSLMILHIDGDRRGASVISIPRDTWVNIPGHGNNKINAAFSFAGPSLVVQTVEQLTNLRIDHLAVIDWEGFKDLTDALGGVTLDIPKTVHDSARGITWEAGRHTLDGQQALDYVGQRYGLPGGDFDRVKRQQYFLKVLMESTLGTEMRKDPRQVYEVLDTITKHLTVDDEWSVGDMRGLAISLRNLRSANIDYLTVPVRGTGREGQQSVVYLDKAAASELWGAVLEDRVAAWIAENPAHGLGATVS